MSKKEQYSHLQTQLEAQSSLCHTIAAHYLKSGNKKQAALYLRYKNSFKADLNSLVSYSNHDKDVPAFHYQEVSYEIENIFPELAANDMEICIERAWNLGNKEVNGNDVVAYVNWNVAWPPEGSPGAGSGKGDTSTSDRGMNPEFNFKKRIDIVRSRPFQRYLERKKATFEVFHYKGFLRKSISLGKATIKLDTLLKKSEIHDVLELVDHVRKPTGGKLEIRIRLRTPYSQSEIITKTEKWLIIDEFNKDFTSLTSSSISTTSSSPAKSSSSSAVTATAATVNATPVNPTFKSQQQKNFIESDSVTSPPKKPTTSSSSPPPASVASSSKTKEQNVSQSLITSNTEAINTGKDDVENIASNLVLQNEIELITNQITTLEAQRKPIPEDLLDRQNELEIKMNLLLISVQTNELTMAEYIERVKASIVNCKKLALFFKKAGKLDEAKKALRRSKIMEDEVKEVEEAIKNGALEM
ncbi:16086_t:CDS:2 [Entrophospora sp. SA101]|nr:9701_t:CDS:2 [Entrophospora sp. SA101]CAJ0634055.1 16086_t:CDS:2 [Entrophospora sp. SA101]CAJ0827425.1 8067_t:CDS:2 [Entrophospora sp. SA101]CAJ0856087.1 291_t:CDS:2 [Entrophospora sp. SA101]